MSDKWKVPQSVSRVDMAFPARGSTPVFLPAWEEIPDEFKEGNAWTRLADKWFARGLSGTELVEKGVDRQAALDHLRVCLGSFGSKHEHKIAGVAYLMSLWFTLANG